MPDPRRALVACLLLLPMLASCARSGGYREEEEADVEEIYAPGTRVQCDPPGGGSLAAVVTGVDEDDDSVTVRYDSGGTATLAIRHCQPVAGAKPRPGQALRSPAGTCRDSGFPSGRTPS
jgi:hypothetical protein